jgi:viologen exporter family transport system permease protein
VWLHLTVARHSFRRYSTYRMATVAGAVTNTVFGIIRAYVLIALWRARPDIGGYDVVDAVTFSFLSQALIAPVNIFSGTLELAQRVRTGDIAVDLYRPADLQAWWLAGDLGRAAFHLIARGLPPLAIGALLFDLRGPRDATAAAALLLSVPLAVVISFAIRYAVSLAAFWLLDERGVNMVVVTVAQFFSGMLLPLVLFPGWLGTVARASPWAGMVQIPIDIWLGHAHDLLTALGRQALWAALLLGLGRALTAAAHRKVVVQGG